MKKPPLISIICLSYNHEKFISECLQGFVMQQTNFPFEIIVHDDASTDNSQKIIKEFESKYPDLFINIYQTENQFSKKEVNIYKDIMFPKARGKYIALCEGDDYWTDPLKLQKQVDFLEKNEEYVMSFTNSNEYFETNNVLIETQYPEKINNLTIPQLLEYGWFIRTATIVFRKNQLDLNFLSKIEYGADYFIHLLLLNQGKFHFLNETTSVYRHHPGGISKSNSAVYLERRLQYIDNLQLLDNYLKRIFSIEIGNEIFKSRIGIFDFAVLNKQFSYLKFIKFNEITPLLYHLSKRMLDKAFRSIKSI